MLADQKKWKITSSKINVTVVNYEKSYQQEIDSKVHPKMWEIVFVFVRKKGPAHPCPRSWRTQFCVCSWWRMNHLIPCCMVILMFHKQRLILVLMDILFCLLSLPLLTSPPPPLLAPPQHLFAALSCFFSNSSCSSYTSSNLIFSFLLVASSSVPLLQLSHFSFLHFPLTHTVVCKGGTLYR